MYQERRDALCNGLREIGWDLPNGKGTMFVWARIPGGRTDSMAFCMELMEKAGVIVTPGASFGPHGEGYVRFALVLPPEKIREVVEAIRKIVKKRIEGGANEKAVLRLFINCPFVCINFDFFWLNKARQLYMDF